MRRRAHRVALRRSLLGFPRLFVALFDPDDDELGALGEEVAAARFSRSGWRVVARRLRTRSGEADLVVRRDGILAVVEVKSGRSQPVPRPAGATLPDRLALRWRPGFRCDARRLDRLRRVARELARAERPPPVESRVDLVEVLLDERPRRFRVLHHPDLRTPLA